MWPGGLTLSSEGGLAVALITLLVRPKLTTTKNTYTKNKSHLINFVNQSVSKTVGAHRNGIVVFCFFDKMLFNATLIPPVKSSPHVCMAHSSFSVHCLDALQIAHESTATYTMQAGSTHYVGSAAAAAAAASRLIHGTPAVTKETRQL